MRSQTSIPFVADRIRIALIIRKGDFVAQALALVLSLFFRAQVFAAAPNRPCADGIQIGQTHPAQSAVVFVSVVNADGQMFSGTAFRVPNNLLLTAGHVALSDTDGVVKRRSRISIHPFQPKIPGAALAKGTVPGLGVKILAHGNISRRDTDWAIIKIDDGDALTPLGVDFLKRAPSIEVQLDEAQNNSQTRQRAAVMGYPTVCDQGGESVLAGAEGALGPLFRQNQLSWFYRTRFWMVGALETISFFSGAASGGSSGGPVLVDRGGQPKAIGVLTGGYENVGAYAPIRGSFRRILEAFLRSS